LPFRRENNLLMCGHFRGETTPGDLPATCLNRRRNPIPVSAINEFLLKHSLRIASNPCISPDFCLDWPALSADVKTGKVTEYAKSRFATKAGEFTLVENAQGDCAWKLHGAGSPLADGVAHAGATFFPGILGQPAQAEESHPGAHDPASTIFPTAGDKLGRSTLGVGARFTTLHWPAVEWAMSALEVGMTANQNSIPRELVYDVDAMLGNRLDTVPFPFIGTNVPEGHQGQSVEGMSHGCVLSKLKRRLPPPQDRLVFQRRPPAHRRQVRQSRRRPRQGMPSRQLHHLRPLTRTRAQPAGQGRRHPGRCRQPDPCARCRRRPEA
jgi:hypothetical protein